MHNKTQKKYNKEIEEAIEILKRYGAKKILLFGSAAKGSLRKFSDLDIACEGIEPGIFFKVFGILLSIGSRRIDLIDLKEAKETLRNRIEKEGILLYEAK